VGRRRTSLALILATSVVALPLIIDRCAASCDAVASAESSPACHHHPPASTESVRPAPAVCGHDHTGMIATQTSTPDHSVVTSAFAPLSPTVDAAPQLARLPREDASGRRWPPGGTPLLSPPLRV
jgi:hypothetical protein